MIKNGKKKKKKYERAERAKQRLFLIHAADQAHLADQDVPIYVVEGAPKGARVRRALREAGLPGVVVHAFGIWTLIPKGADDRHRLNPDWHAFLRPGRRVVLLPDSDAEPGGTAVSLERGGAPADARRRRGGAHAPGRAARWQEVRPG